MSGRSLPETEPQELTEAALRELAEIARVPGENIAEFCERMVGAFERARIAYREAGDSAHRTVPAFPPEVILELAKIAKKAAALHDSSRAGAKQVPASIMAALKRRGINVTAERVHL